MGLCNIAHPIKYFSVGGKFYIERVITSWNLQRFVGIDGGIGGWGQTVIVPGGHWEYSGSPFLPISKLVDE